MDSALELLPIYSHDSEKFISWLNSHLMVFQQCPMKTPLDYISYMDKPE